MKELIRDKPLASLIKKKREKTQINKIMNERGEITTNTKDIQMILNMYYEQLSIIRQSRRNGDNSGKPQTTKTGIGRNRKPEQADNQGGNGSCHQKPPKTQKSRARWLPRGILPNV